MLKSTDDFKKAVYNTLVKIRDDEDWIAIQQAMTSDEYAAIPKHIVESGYVDGLQHMPKLGGGGYVGTPALTARGLQFIEEHSN